MQNTNQNQQPKSTTGQDATQNKGQQGQSFDKTQSADKNQASNQNASSQSPSSSKVGSNTQKDEPRANQGGSMKNDASEGSVRKASNA